MVNRKNHAGETPIFRHVQLGATTALIFLIAYGANVNTKNGDGQTPLHIACSRPKLIKTVALLLGKGAIIDAEDKDGQTPLRIATKATNTAAIKLLMTSSKGKRTKTKRRSLTDPSGRRSPSKTSIPIPTRTTPGTEILVDSKTLAKLNLPPRKTPIQSTDYSAFGSLVRQQSTPPSEKKDLKPTQYGELSKLVRPRATSLRQPHKKQERKGRLSDPVARKTFMKRYRRKILTPGTLPPLNKPEES